MKQSLCALIVCLTTTPAIGGEVSDSTLAALGLSGLERLSDSESMKIRGRSSSATASGGSFVVGQLSYTNEFNTFTQFDTAAISFRFADNQAGLNAFSAASQNHFAFTTNNLFILPTAMAPGFSGSYNGQTGTNVTAAGGTAMATAQ